MSCNARDFDTARWTCTRITGRQEWAITWDYEEGRREAGGELIARALSEEIGQYLVRKHNAQLGGPPACGVGPEGDGLTFYAAAYDIPWSRLDSYPKLLEWVKHLSEKSWVTADDLGAFVELVERRFGWPPHRGA